MKARENPFRTSRLSSIPFRPQGADWTAIMARLEALGFRAAIVGPEGSGKTTMLEGLVPRLKSRGLSPHVVTLTKDTKEDPCALLRKPCSTDCLLLDGCDELGAISWLKVRLHFRSAGGLIVAGHKPGRLPTLLYCRTSPGLLAELAAELLPDAIPCPGEMPERIFQRHKGNLRQCLLELYRAAAGLERL